MSTVKIDPEVSNNSSTSVNSDGNKNIKNPYIRGMTKDKVSKKRSQFYS